MWKDELRMRRLQGHVWKVKTMDLQRAIDHALHTHKKTPLVIDNTEGGLATKYLEYQDEVVISGDELLRVEPKKDAESPSSNIPNRVLVVEAQQEYLRKKLVAAMIMGSKLHVQLGDTSPDFAGVFCDDTKFPLDIFATEQLTTSEGSVARVVARGLVWLRVPRALRWSAFRRCTHQCVVVVLEWDLMSCVRVRMCPPPTHTHIFFFSLSLSLSLVLFLSRRRRGRGERVHELCSQHRV